MIQNGELSGLGYLWRHKTELELPFIIDDFLRQGDHDIAKEVGLGESIELATSKAEVWSICMTIEVVNNCEKKFVTEREQGDCWSWGEWRAQRDRRSRHGEWSGMGLVRLVRLKKSLTSLNRSLEKAGMYSGERETQGCQ